MILSGDEQTDYINANYVNITVGSETFYHIATQGPLPKTASDFWRMAWEQKCQVIAMVTQDMESGKVKCHRYWPESTELPVKVNQKYDVIYSSFKSFFLIQKSCLVYLESSSYHFSLDVHLQSVETHKNYVTRNIRIENIQVCIVDVGILSEILVRLTLPFCRFTQTVLLFHLGGAVVKCCPFKLRGLA